MVSSGRGHGRSRPGGQPRPGGKRPHPRRTSPSRPATSRSGPARTTGRPGGARASSGATGPSSRGSRPSARGGLRAVGTPPRGDGRRPRLTGRSAIVVVVLAVLFVSYATSLRAYFSQRAHIDELEARIAQDTAAISELREEQRRWQDDAFVEAQARERFGWVLPGEVGLRVIGEDGKPLDVSSELTDPASMGRDPDDEWWTRTWTSIRGAGAKPRPEADPTVRFGPPPRDRPGRQRESTGGG